MASKEWSTLQLPLSGWLLSAFSAMGFTQMTPVQASTIPLFMGHKDVVVEAVTGSGKTLAFLIPIIERLLKLDEPLKRHHVGAIILSPTRELAAQIYGVLTGLLAFHEPSAASLGILEAGQDGPEADASAESYKDDLKVTPQLVVGGDVPVAEDRKRFLSRSPNCLVGTPGRLLDLLSMSRVHCPQSSFQVLVVDEADRMLDIGFKDDLQKIISILPKQRRTGLFSASVSEAMDQIVRVGLRNPVRIAVRVKGSSGNNDQKTPSSLKIKYIVAKASHRFPIMSKLLSNLQPHPYKTMVYLSTCAAVDYFQHVLGYILRRVDGSSVQLITLHGKHSPQTRRKHFSEFRDSVSPCVLLTTDIAARGLDIPKVDLVIQVDPPSDPKVFLHRCGRAGRAGRRGLSIIFLRSGREEDYIPFLQVRNTPATPLKELYAAVTDEEAEVATSKMREVVLRDRAVHDKAQRAFVSWVRSYSKHEASSIFRIVDIDWYDACKAWALLKIPKMPEIKGWQGDSSLGLNIDFKTFKYKNEEKEKQRHMKGESGTTDQQWGCHKSEAQSRNRSWSKNLIARHERKRKREQRQLKREHEEWNQKSESERKDYAEMQRIVGEVKKRKSGVDNGDEFGGFED